MNDHSLSTSFSNAGEFALLVRNNDFSVPILRLRTEANRCSVFAVFSLLIPLLCACLLSNVVSATTGVLCAWAAGLVLFVCLRTFSHSLWLLTPLAHLVSFSEITHLSNESSRALAWLQRVENERRELYGFDLQIMSMLAEAERLSSGHR